MCLAYATVSLTCAVQVRTGHTGKQLVGSLGWYHRQQDVRVPVLAQVSGNMNAVLSAMGGSSMGAECNCTATQLIAQQD